MKWVVEQKIDVVFVGAAGTHCCTCVHDTWLCSAAMLARGHASQENLTKAWAPSLHLWSSKRPAMSWLCAPVKSGCMACYI